MITVGLHGAEFFALHGYYPEEQILGNKFIVDIEVKFEPAGDLHQDDLSNTVNYEQLYLIAAQQMKQTRQLLETVAQAIADQIRTEHPGVSKITVRLKKLNPPVQGPVAYSSITITDHK